jgi:hypothetical protein
METKNEERTIPGTERSASWLYAEDQRFRQKWIIALVLIPVVLSWAGVFVQLVLGIPFGTNPASNGMLVFIFLLVGIGLPIAMYKLELRIRVNGEGIHYQYFPFHLRLHTLRFGDIDTSASITYHPILEYGGWGIRYGKTGKAYNVSGNKGVLVTLRNGRTILFGSQRADEFAKMLEGIKN